MTVSNRTYLADVLVTALAFMLAVFILSAVGVALKAKNYVRVPLLVRITGLLGVASGAACASLVAWCMYTFPDVRHFGRLKLNTTADAHSCYARANADQNITPIPWNEPWSNVVDGKAFSLHPFLMTLAFGLLGIETLTGSSWVAVRNLSGVAWIVACLSNRLRWPGTQSFCGRMPCRAHCASWDVLGRAGHSCGVVCAQLHPTGTKARPWHLTDTSLIAKYPTLTRGCDGVTALVYTEQSGN
eukprot:scaffold4_cov396-Prasinococcus_capsulatus_cf.AAC.15